jgi:hypothetical protein
MSPYTDVPKNPRSQEWGREAIEMHENGSTKNLLQMTDVYYSVGVCGSRLQGSPAQGSPEGFTGTVTSASKTHCLLIVRFSGGLVTWSSSV